MQRVRSRDGQNQEDEMAKAKLILNPQANHGRAYETAGDLRHLADDLGGAEWVGTDFPGHAVQLAREAALAGYDPIVSVGGDGTVHEVVNGLMSVEAAHRPRLGVIPLGSGNDFVSGAGLEARPLVALQRILTTADLRPIDIGWIRDESGRTEYWDNTVGIGFDAAVNLQSRRITRIHGFLMYLLAVIKVIIQNYDAPHMEVELNGAKFSDDLLMFTAGNGPREGGGFITTPEAKLDDGELDYAYIRRVSRLMMIRLIPEVMNGRHGRFKPVKLGRMKSVRLCADRALPIHTDGEMFASYEANVRCVELGVEPLALRLVV